MVMTPPRMIRAGQFCFVTVNAVNGSFRFVPKAHVTETIWYCLAVTLRKYRGRIALHEFQWLSNHFHLELTDVVGCVPAFMEELDSLLSRALNALRGTRGTNIEKGYNLTIDVTDDKVFEHCVYTQVNCCNANLVDRVRDWKGASSHRLEYGKPITIKRPRHGLWADGAKRTRSKESRRSRRAAYSGRSKLPESVSIVLSRPDIYPTLSDTELRAKIRDEVRCTERALASERRKAGTRVLGWNKVVARKFTDLPRKGPEPFGLVPSYAAGKNRPAREQAAQTRREFMKAYYNALREFIGGNAKAVFPHGTWLMKRRFEVRCCPPAPT